MRASLVMLWTCGRGVARRNTAVPALDAGRFGNVSEVRPMEPPFAVQLFLACPPVERAHSSPCAGTITGSAVLANECVGAAVRDVDDFAARLRPNYLEERRTEVIEAPADVGSYRAKCGDVEVVENFDGCIGKVLMLRPRIHTSH
ncbi:hypothetical protein BRD02_05025 [Halobacteriales archaeon QS_8_69_73]|nr:MAG: hypothetical protein BRD02_05025 [Halobacteriales archaeon QS_8_69_73]